MHNTERIEELMTRDYIAIKVLPTLIKEMGWETLSKDKCAEAYMYADLMIEMSNRKEIK